MLNNSIISPRTSLKHEELSLKVTAAGFHSRGEVSRIKRHRLTRSLKTCGNRRRINIESGIYRLRTRERSSWRWRRTR